MAKTLEISVANPLYFRIETGSGAINEGAAFLDNYLYSEIGDYFGCEILPVDSMPGQCWNCGDAIIFQVYYDDDRTGDVLYARINEAASGGIIFDMVAPFSNTNFIVFAADLSGLPCPGCYQVEIVSAVPDSGVFLDWGTIGTFEDKKTWDDNWSTGSGLNTRSRSAAQAQAGTYSAFIQAPLSPTSVSGQILITTNQQTVTANAVYEISGYVYHNSALPFGSAGQLIEWTIFSSTAQIISETVFTIGTDPDDQWVRISVLFSAGSDTSIQFQIMLSDGSSAVAPLGLGSLFTDTHRMDLYVQTVEATSEPQSVQEDCGCTALVSYTGTSFQFGMMFDNVTPLIHYYRAPLNVAPMRMESDPDTVERKKSTAGEWANIAYSAQKVRTIQSDMVDGHTYEKLALTTQFESVTLNGVKVTRTAEEISEEVLNDGAAYRLQFELVTDYGYRRGGCL